MLQYYLISVAILFSNPLASATIDTITADLGGIFVFHTMRTRREAPFFAMITFSALCLFMGFSGISLVTRLST